MNAENRTRDGWVGSANANLNYFDANQATIDAYQLNFELVDPVELHEELDRPQVVGLVVLLSLLPVQEVLE